MGQTIKGFVKLGTPHGGAFSLHTDGFLYVTGDSPDHGQAITKLDTLTALQLADALVTFAAERVSDDVEQTTELAKSALRCAEAQVELAKAKERRDAITCYHCNGQGCFDDDGPNDPPCIVCGGEGQVASC